VRLLSSAIMRHGFGAGKRAFRTANLIDFVFDRPNRAKQVRVLIVRFD
jgi:hypothetical protein